MNTIIISALVGLVVGIGGTIGVVQVTKPQKVIPSDDTTSKEQQEVIKQLTNLDLVKPICEPGYIDKHGDLLCRELTCLQFSRGIDSKTNHCEQISNIQNKMSILDKCMKPTEEGETKTKDQITNCIDIFWRRN